MKQFVLTTIAFWLSFTAIAQQAATEAVNIVPNSGFEEFAAPPIGWFYKGKHFSNVVKYWDSPTSASPDVFGPRVRVPEHWAQKGFGKMKAHGGGCMAGITIYGCENGKPHCREYVQVQLSEPMIPGQEYYFELFVSHLPQSLQASNIGIYLSPESIRKQTDELIVADPQIVNTNITSAKNKWKKLSTKIVAEEAYTHLIIGNFFPDTLTKIRKTNQTVFNYSYYYIDDVLLKKLPPYLPQPIEQNDLSYKELERGTVVVLENIYFEFDKWDLHPRSFMELNKLVKILEEHPEMIIQVNGHADSVGDDRYNLYLSRRRARSVIQYLNEQGIPRNRTLYRGFGSQKPIASNETEEGRQQNRRVEFLVLHE